MKIIPFNPGKRIIEKAQAYIKAPYLVTEKPDHAVPAILRALPYAGPPLKQRLILLIGGIARDVVAWSLFEICTDPEESEEVRHMSAIQLSLTLSRLNLPALRNRLMEILQNADPELRNHAAIALGWQKNVEAIPALTRLLSDPDAQVHQSAATALADIGEPLTFDTLRERLATASSDLKRAILYNLWRFSTRRKDAESVYLDHLEDSNEQTRYDALVLLGTVSHPARHLGVYEKALDSSNPMARVLALNRLSKVDAGDLKRFESKIRKLSLDVDSQVREAALKLLARSMDMQGPRPFLKPVKR
jgi:hypothetical protein